MKKNQTANDIKRSPGLMIILSSISIQSAKKGSDIVVQMPSKKIKHFNTNCRATIGRVAGHGRVDKPFLKLISLL